MGTPQILENFGVWGTKSQVFFSPSSCGPLGGTQADATEFDTQWPAGNFLSTNIIQIDPSVRKPRSRFVSVYNNNQEGIIITVVGNWPDNEYLVLIAEQS